VASGVPGIYGLYATIVPLLAYALFGPSRILVLGPDSSLAAVILAVVFPLSGGDPMRAVAVASVMAIVSGLVCILIGLMRLGFVTELLSKPIRYGYMNGIALTVLISQLPKLFGFSIDGIGPVRDLQRIAEAVLSGEANWTAFTVGICTLAAVLLLKPFKRIPGLLIAVVGATAVVGVLGLRRKRRRESARSAAARFAIVRSAVDQSRRPRPSGHWWRRRRHGGLRRHQRLVAHVCGQDPLQGGSEPGNDRPGRRQPRRWTVPGFSDQQ
jgi:MFS superfamily sulfate permease-like transporter